MKYKVEVARTTVLTIEVDAPPDDRGSAREQAVELACRFPEERWKEGYTEIESQGCDPA